MDRTLTGIVVALLSALVLVGLTFSRSVDPPADFRFNNQTEPQTLDVHLMTGVPEERYASALFEGFTRRNPRTLQPAPGVAESWDVSPDGKRYVFHLRTDARWSDGRPVTASDFVFSWRRLLDPKTGSEYAYMAYPVRYAEALHTYAGHAEMLSNQIAKAVEELTHTHPDGLDAAEWQRFLAKNGVHDPLRHEADEALRELLGRRTARVTRADLDGFAVSVGRAALHLRQQSEEARTHFGVDGGIVALDDHTAVVELRAPTPYFLDVTSHYSLMPVPRWLVTDPKRRDDWFLPEHIVSNGAYVLKRWLVHDHLRLERSETYWGKSEVRMASIDVRTVESDTTVLNLFLTHAIDWDPEMYPRELGAELRRRSDFITTPSLSVYFYRLNTTRPPLNDRRVRKALNLAIDRKLLTEQVLGLGQPPATRLVPPGIAGYAPPESDLGLDVPRARALLAEAGFPNGKGIPEVGILYNTNQGHKAIAEFVADELRRNLGIHANAYNQEWQSYLDTSRMLDYDISRYAWLGDYADPNTFLDLFVTNGGNNETGFSSPVYDRLIAAAADVSTVVATPERFLAGLEKPAEVRTLAEAVRRAATPAESLQAQAKLRMSLLREAEAVLLTEVPLIPLYFYVVANMVSPKLRGFYTTLHFDDGTTAPNLQDVHPLRDMWMDRSASGP